MMQVQQVQSEQIAPARISTRWVAVIINTLVVCVVILAALAAIGRQPPTHASAATQPPGITDGSTAPAQ